LASSTVIVSPSETPTTVPLSVAALTEAHATNIAANRSFLG